MQYFNKQEALRVLKENYGKMISMSLLILIVCGLLYIFAKEIDFHHLKHLMKEHQSLSTFLFILVFMLKSFLVILPSYPLIILAGSVYGTMHGFIVSMIGMLLSAGLAFFIGRKAGSDVIHRILGNRAKYLNNKMDDYGIRIIAIIRASFLVPYDILSYMAGITKMKLSHFLMGTCIGIVAEVLSLSYLGHHLKKPGSKGFILAIITIVVVVAVPALYTKFFGIKKTNTEKMEATLGEKHSH